jgi:hypothetical protein
MLAAELLLPVLRQAEPIDPNHFNLYLIGGYFVMWVIAMIYIYSLANRQRNVKEEVKLLRQLLEDDEEHNNR